MDLHCHNCNNTRDIICCERCSKSYCVSCDNKQDKLKWVEVSEDTDEYLCSKCAKKARISSELLEEPLVLEA
jgi:hypothetical protein